MIKTRWAAAAAAGFLVTAGTWAAARGADAPREERVAPDGAEAGAGDPAVERFRGRGPRGRCDGVGRGLGRGLRGPRLGGCLLTDSPLAEDLSLTPDQRERIRAIYKDSLPVLEPLLERHADARAALFDAVHAEKADEHAIREASAAVAEAGADIGVARARIREKVAAVLTPEQAAKLREARGRTERRREMRRRIGRERAEEWIEAL